METDTTPSRKSPDTDCENQTRKQNGKTTIPLSNGVFKRNHQQKSIPVVVVYKECLKNHAASIGGHALDGCGEFMPSSGSTVADPTYLKCAACGCHRNFHRRDPDDSPPRSMALPPHPAIEYHPHHRHHPPPPPRSPNSASPPPISSSYYPHSAPHMLLSLSSPHDGHPHPPPTNAHVVNLHPRSGGRRKRFRTKFTQNQKEKMLEFAEQIGWKIQRRDEDIIQEFCHEVGVDRKVLKVWMHNNKSTVGKSKSAINVVSINLDDHLPRGGSAHMVANGSWSSS